MLSLDVYLWQAWLNVDWACRIKIIYGFKVVKKLDKSLSLLYSMLTII